MPCREVHGFGRFSEIVMQVVEHSGDSILQGFRIAEILAAPVSKSVWVWNGRAGIHSIIRTGRDPSVVRQTATSTVPVCS